MPSAALPHKPVLLIEVLEFLRLQAGMTVVDGTLGNGGHAIEILKRIGSQGRLIGMDQDPSAIGKCRERLLDFPQVVFRQENFENVERVLDRLNIPSVDAVILDVGFSSDQLEDGTRGFSFEREGPLDMRMNPFTTTRARDLVNKLSAQKLEKLFCDYGEERYARRFAQGVCRARELNPIQTTQDLVHALMETLPYGLRAPRGRRPARARRHPATRVFQALRIAVNDELRVLDRALPLFWQRLKPGGRMAVISFHSLEDRIVKNHFRQWYRDKKALRITKSPITPSRDEVRDNPRARSAKLRVVEKIDARGG